jgi:hypothetical protein
MHSITTFPIMFAFAYFDAIFCNIENNIAYITLLLYYYRMKQNTALAFLLPYDLAPSLPPAPPV